MAARVTTGPARRRALQALRHDRALAVAATLLFIGLLLAHSLAAPSFRGPDEPQHFDLVRAWSLGQGYEVIGREYSEQITQALPIVDFHGRSRHLPQHTAPARDDRPRFDELGPDEPSRYNQISQHGPLYPVIGGTVVRLVDLVEPGPRWSFDREVGVVRLLTIGMLSVVPWLVFSAARQLGLARGVSFAAALLPGAIPQLTHVGGTVNNDNLLTALAAVVLVLTVRLVADVRRRGWEDAALGFACGLAVLTKSFAIAILAGVAVAYALHWARVRPGRASAARQAVVVAVAGTVGGGWWYVRNAIVLGQVQPRGQRLLADAPEGFEPDAWRWWAAFRSAFPARFFGDFGWFDVAVGSGWVGVSMVLAAGAVVAVFVRVGAWRPPITRLTATVLLVPFLVALLVAAAFAWASHVRSGRFPAMQGRYVFVAVPSLVVLVAAGWSHLLGRLRRALPIAVVVGVLAFQAEGLTTILGYYWAPPGGSLRDQVAAMLTWSPWPPSVSLAFLAVLPFGALAAASLAVAEAVRPGSDAPSST